MIVGNVIEYKLIKQMRDSIWAETSKLVEDDPWHVIRVSTRHPVTILVVDSKTLIRLL